MGKRKQGSGLTSGAGNENGDGWLSTRNKKKISPPPLKTPGAHHFIRRPIPRSPLVMLMEGAPSQLKSATKQTSIADFFNPPRLKPLPLQGNLEQEVIHPKHKAARQGEAVEVCDEIYENLYSDFDIPSSVQAKTEAVDVAEADNPSPAALKADTTFHSDFDASSAEDLPRCRKMANKRRSESFGKEKCRKASRTSLGDTLPQERNPFNQHENRCTETNLKTEDESEGSDNSNGGDFADSLQTPRFLRQETSIDLDESTLTDMPISNYEKNQRDRPPVTEDEDSSLPPEIFKEQSSLGLSSDLSGFCLGGSSQSQEPDSQPFETTKQEKSSLELNVNCCPSSSDSEKFNDSLTPTFLDTDPGDSEQRTSSDSTQKVFNKRKVPSILQSETVKTLFKDDIQTPSFLRGLEDPNLSENGLV